MESSPRWEILHRMGTQEDLDALDRLAGEIPELEEQVAHAKATVAETEENLHWLESKVLMEGVEGKNEAERKAALVVAVEADEAYVTARTNYREVKTSVRLGEGELATARERQRFLYRRIDLRRAQLVFLAGGE